MQLSVLRTTATSCLPDFSCSPNDALGSRRDILESDLVLASAAECVSADLSGEVFDMIYLPAGAFVENFELEWLWGASPQIEKFHRVP